MRQEEQQAALTRKQRRLPAEPESSQAGSVTIMVCVCVWGGGGLTVCPLEVGSWAVPL